MPRLSATYLLFCLCGKVLEYPTRQRMTFVNTTAIAYTKMIRFRPIFFPYAIAVVFTNVMRLRVRVQILRSSARVPYSACS